MTACGIVVIGRNEGERLRRCIASLSDVEAPIVYVDSSSHDGSAAWARSVGLTVVELDSSRPMSAARARNAGFDCLVTNHPDLEYVQFVDGDCALFAGWVERGVAALDTMPHAGIVCGRVIERHPEASIYNLMCNIEWRKDPGEIDACGGIFMVRAEAFRAVGGFRIDVMAAEDDELCLRIRRRGLKVVAVAEPMVLHDAAIIRFSQWWTRARRAGMAYAQGADLHGSGPEAHFRANCRRAWFWAAGVPVGALGLSWPTHGLSLLAFLGYPALAARIYRRGRARRQTPKEAALVAVFTVIAKWPELQGILHYHHTRWRKRHVELIEYKGLTTNDEGATGGGA
ncbi:MAG: glycosyltransferase family 2 protein [Polyangiaceae bacterium]|nr:glycosyltransferase family 2 protein [Polyangiaceae bacterium]